MCNTINYISNKFKILLYSYKPSAKRKYMKTIKFRDNRINILLFLVSFSLFASEAYPFFTREKNKNLDQINQFSSRVNAEIPWLFQDFADSFSLSDIYINENNDKNTDKLENRFRLIIAIHAITTITISLVNSTSPKRDLCDSCIKDIESEIKKNPLWTSYPRYSHHFLFNNKLHDNNNNNNNECINDIKETIERFKSHILANGILDKFPFGPAYTAYHSMIAAKVSLFFISSKRLNSTFKKNIENIFNNLENKNKSSHENNNRKVTIKEIICHKQKIIFPSYQFNSVIDTWEKNEYWKDDENEEKEKIHNFLHKGNPIFMKK